jgi:cytoskeletal protein CcmA (bactofilin family)
MARIESKTVFTIGLLMLLMAVPAFGASVNKSIRIGDGEEADGATTVNGSISVGEDALVTGGMRTVNGSIRVERGATVRDARTVNGTIRLAEGVETRHLNTVNGAILMGAEGLVDGDVSAVNGSITLEEKARVTGDIDNVNGKIFLDHAQAEGNIKTVSGDIRLRQAVVKGDLLIEKPGIWSSSSKKRKPRIIIGPGSRVEGTIDIEHEVELFISDTAEIGDVKGVMSVDDATRFSGEEP